MLDVLLLIGRVLDTFPLLVLFATKIYLVYFSCIFTIGASLGGIFVGICCWDEDWFWFWVWVWFWDVEEVYWVVTFLLEVEFGEIDDGLETLLLFEERVEFIELDELFEEYVLFEVTDEFPGFWIFEEFEVVTWVCVWLVELDEIIVLLFLITFGWLEFTTAFDEFDTAELFEAVETVETVDWFVLVLFVLFIFDKLLVLYLISEITISRILTSYVVLCSCPLTVTIFLFLLKQSTLV